MADILVVDDNVDLAETLSAVLEIAGHVVRVATDGRAGLAALDERLPDLVILDVEMPVLDGPGMARRMLVEDLGREDVPILIASALCDLSQVVARVGTPYFIAKPCGIEELMSVVDRALRERAPPRPPRSVLRSYSGRGEDP